MSRNGVEASDRTFEERDRGGARRQIIPYAHWMAIVWLLKGECFGEVWVRVQLLKLLYAVVYAPCQSCLTRSV